MADSRLPCTVDPQRPDNCTPILACGPAAVMECNARGCVCVLPAPPVPATCLLTITYPIDNPGNVMVIPPPDACGAGMEIAIAALLARLLAQ